MNVVIFGKGKVGMATDLTLKTNATFHDPAKGFVVEDFSQFDMAFICVSSLVSGPYDHQAIQECLDKLNKEHFTGLIALRCTVSPVFLKAWSIQYPKLKLIYFPEFMKQGDDDYLDKPWVVVIGGEEGYAKQLGSYLMQKQYGTPDMLLYCTLEEGALIKLHQNAGLALKVTFANIMYEACQAFGANYETVRKGVGADARVGPGHLQVPGEHGYGFSGHCLPKDLKCLNSVAYNRGFWDNILRVNNELRDKDV